MALGIGPGAVWATDHEVAEYGPVLDACYQKATDAEGLEACRGKMAEVCMETQDGGYSTLGMSSCAAAEAQVWDKYLNSEYKKTMAWAKAADASEAVHFPGYATRAESLRAAQRAWIIFRDAECGLAYAAWGSGSMRHIAGTSCLSDMAATRTIELYRIRNQFE